MKKLLTYKGYQASVEFDAQDEIFVGHILGINDVVGFHGESVPELKAAFEEAVDDYLNACEKAGKSPDKFYSGNLMLRVAPEVHASASLAAEAEGLSLNQWSEKVLRGATATEDRLSLHSLTPQDRQTVARVHRRMRSLKPRQKITHRREFSRHG